MIERLRMTPRKYCLPDTTLGIFRVPFHNSVEKLLSELILTF